MIHAYDEICLERASDTLGRMLDYSVYSLHYDIPSMMDLFIASGVAAGFERGDIRTIAGMSGKELAYEVLEKSGLSFDRTQSRYTRSLSAEYWYGYALARIQWNTCTSFARITKAFSSQSFISEYGKNRLAFLDSLPLDISEEKRKTEIKEFGIKAANEAVSQYLERLQSKYAAISAKGSFAVSDKGSASTTIAAHKLKNIRLLNGLSQSELATVSGIPVRTIQQYEQGQKNLAKARAEYLISLARALNCDPASLI